MKSQQACAELCASTSGGLFWTYIIGQKRCLVKSSDSDRRDMGGRVSGNRDCGLGKTLSVRNNTFVLLKSCSLFSKDSVDGTGTEEGSGSPRPGETNCSADQYS